MNRNLRQGRQRSKIELLAEWLIRIAWTGRDMGGEIFNSTDRIPRQQKLAELFWVHPAIRSFPKRPIVEVEAVDVDVGDQFSGSRNAEAALRRLRARLPKQPGGYGATIRY